MPLCNLKHSTWKFTEIVIVKLKYDISYFDHNTHTCAPSRVTLFAARVA